MYQACGGDELEVDVLMVETGKSGNREIASRMGTTRYTSQNFTRRTRLVFGVLGVLASREEELHPPDSRISGLVGSLDPCRIPPLATVRAFPWQTVPDFRRCVFSSQHNGCFCFLFQLLLANRPVGPDISQVVRLPSPLTNETYWRISPLKRALAGTYQPRSAYHFPARANSTIAGVVIPPVPCQSSNQRDRMEGREVWINVRRPQRSSTKRKMQDRIKIRERWGFVLRIE